MFAFEVNTPKTASIAAGLTECLKVRDNVPKSSGKPWSCRQCELGSTLLRSRIAFVHGPAKRSFWNWVLCRTTALLLNYSVWSETRPIFIIFYILFAYFLTTSMSIYVKSPQIMSLLELDFSLYWVAAQSNLERWALCWSPGSVHKKGHFSSSSAAWSYLVSPFVKHVLCDWRCGIMHGTG